MKQIFFYDLFQLPNTVDDQVATEATFHRYLISQ